MKTFTSFKKLLLLSLILAFIANTEQSYGTFQNTTDNTNTISLCSAEDQLCI